MGEGVRFWRDDERDDLLSLSGAGWREFREGVGGIDVGGDGGRAGSEETIIDKLSRLSSLTSSIRERRLRCLVGEGQLLDRKSSRLSSTALDGRSVSRAVSDGLLDLDRDREREREREREMDRESLASSRRTLPAPRLGIALLDP